MLARVKPFVIYLCTLAAILTVLIGCARSTQPQVANQKVNVVVKVNIQDSTAHSSKNSDPRTTVFSQYLSKVVLTVKDENENEVYKHETSEKKDIQFSLQLANPGKYTFIVEGFDEEENRLFSGTVETVVNYGNNVIPISTKFDPGVIQATIEVDNAVWRLYSVDSARLIYKKDSDAQEQNTMLNINRQTISENLELTPGVWNVKFDVKLTAKHSNTQPSVWEPKELPSISVFLKPSRKREVKFKILYNYENEEPQIVVVLTNIELPYVEPVENLKAVWNKRQNRLIVSWEYNTTTNVKFYVYKIIEESTQAEEEEYFYEQIGWTTEKSFTIENYDEAEHNRIAGVAVNAVVNGKESGPSLLMKSSFEEHSEVGKIENLKAYYDGANLKLTWTCDGTADKFRIYKRIGNSATYQLITEVASPVRESHFPLSESEFNNLSEIAISVVYNNTEHTKEALNKDNILPFDGGDGTENSPYQIRTAWQLQRLNDDAYRNKGYHFELVADIDMTGRNWIPIGTYSSELSNSAFQGKLDGKNHKIANLRYNNGASGSYVGLFGYLYNSTVTNLIIENASITANLRVGTLAGASRNSTVERVKVINSTIRAELNGRGYAGGLIGEALEGTIIKECAVVNSIISGRRLAIGGLLGQLKGSAGSPVRVENCYVQGGEVRSDSSFSIAAAGFICDYDVPTRGGEVKNNYAAIRVRNGQGFVGYIVTTGNDKGASGNYFDREVAGTALDKLLNKGVTPKTTAEMKSQSTYTSWDFDGVWKIDEGKEYPKLRWEP